MKMLLALLFSVLVASIALAEEPGPTKTSLLSAALPETPVLWDSAGALAPAVPCAPTNRFAGNHNFDCFIGFMSNPLLNIDPRAVTELWPIAGRFHVSGARAVPDGEIWIPPSAGIYIALSERLSFGLNQGGYAIADLNSNAPGVFRDRFGILRNRADFARQREGWLNLGGFVQYTFYEDIPGQALASAGIRWEAPIGSQALFQGIGPARLSPYLTVGKAFGNVHVLATAGYSFPAGSGGTDTDFFYSCLHIDRQTFGWLYPLVEVNWIYHHTGIVDDLPQRGGLIDLSGFSGEGNLVSLAVGANAILIPNKLEFGAVYMTPIATSRDFNFNGVLVKMTIRF